MKNDKKKYVVILILLFGVYFFYKLDGWRCFLVTAIIIGWIYNIVNDDR
jgi:hypothetical protein